MKPKGTQREILKLNIGCGDAHKNGFINIDRQNADMNIDVREGLPFETNSVDFIYCSHFIEHLSHDEAWRFLDESFRVLKRGGKIRLSTPDLRIFAEKYLARDSLFWDSRRWPGKTSADQLNYVLREMGHLYIYDFESLQSLLRSVGFTQIRQVPFDVSLDNRPDVSVFVEAEKFPAGQNPNTPEYMDVMWAGRKFGVISEQPERIELYKQVASMCKGPNVLDVGCGDAALLSYLPDHVQKHGVDFSSVAIDRARERNIGHFEVGDIYKLGYGPDVFDTVIMMEVLEHIDDADGAVSEAVRVMKDGARLIITVPDQECITDEKWPGGVSLHVSNWSENKVKSLASRCGLSVAEVRKFGPNLVFALTCCKGSLPRTGFTDKLRTNVGMATPNESQPSLLREVPSLEKNNRCLKMQMIGTEYGGWAVDLDLIPFGSTVISAGIGEDISFDLGLISLRNCRVVGIDPTEKARKFIENNRNERFDYLQKALYSDSSKRIRIYRNINPDYVSESIVRSHKSVSQADSYEAETISIEDILNKYENVSVLKLDIEGAEYEVLNSIRNLEIAQICVEFHHFCTDFTVDDTARCIKRLQRMGYVLAHSTSECGAVKQATFVHRKYLSAKAANASMSESEAYLKKDTPVILVCYNRPKHTLEVLKALKKHNVSNLYIFSDAPKSPADSQAVELTRRLVHAIDWTKPNIIERKENLGLARNIVSAVDYVFERYDRLILLEDDCVPQRYFFDFMHTCLEKYENCQRVFGISGYTVRIPDHIRSRYPYDLYFCPRIGSWGWGTWKRAWQKRGKDIRELMDAAVKEAIDLEQGGTDIPVTLDKILKGNMKDVWTLQWVLSVYLNNGVYIYPTKSHIRNVGMDGTGIHCKATDKYDSPCCDTRPLNYPDEVFLDKDMMANFRSYYDVDPVRKAGVRPVTTPGASKAPMKICYINTSDIKGGASRVGWMLKQGLRQRGFQIAMLVKNKMSADPEVKTITDSVLDSGTHYADQGYMYYDIQSTFRLRSQPEFSACDVAHFHNLHGDYFNPFALPDLTKSKPSVWTLHDMHSMTGHCAYAFDCEKWQTGCGNCPHLEAYPPVAKDRTAEMWRDKKVIYRESDFELIVPSQWLKHIVEKSILKEKRLHLIYNGIDEGVYRPLDRRAIRQTFKVPLNAIVIGFVAHGGLIDKRKGGDFILETYRYLTAKYPNVFFICVGGRSNKAPTERFVQVPFLLDEEKLVQLYCAADIFLFPTLADNCPLVVLEVMGCGTPVVSFNTGGVPELIEHGRTGLIAGFKNSEEFIRLTEYLVVDRVKREEFGAASRERLLRMFTLEQMIDKHVALYERLAEEDKKKNYLPPKSRVALPAAIDERQYKYLVSAIVSTYNSERFIRGCLEDLENQTIADKLEIIVVNSGSRENEEAIVREYQQKYDNIVYIKTEHREGIYAAWNRAIKVARGEFLTNANTDDRHREDALEIMAAMLPAQPEVVLVYGDQICTDTANGTFAHHHPTEMATRPDYSRDRLLWGCCVGSQPMWRKSLHDEFGYFDESLDCAGDWDFWLRVSGKYPFRHVREFLGLYYMNEDGIERGRKIHSLYERYVVGRRYGNPYISVIPLCTSTGNPLVSVIMPAYNAADHVAEAIESVLIQNYRHFELIVVDDGSTDATQDIVSGFQDDKIRWFHQANAGPASARNLALKKCNGDFISFLDADDMITPDFLSRHLQEFDKHPQADLIYCDDFLMDKNLKPLRVIQSPEYSERKLLIRDMFRCGFPVVPFRTCMRRSVFDKIGLFDEGLVVGEDYDMMRRFIRHGLNAHHLKHALYLRRMTDESLSRSHSPEKARCHFDVVKRFPVTFTDEELFPDVPWGEIPAEERRLHAQCLAVSTYLAIGQDFAKSKSPNVYVEKAFEAACSQLNECLNIDPDNREIRELLYKCEHGKQQYSEKGQQVVCCAH